MDMFKFNEFFPPEVLILSEYANFTFRLTI